VAVLPSLEEGFPNAVLEAMAAGKPVVASRVGGIAEAVIHEETGLLVPPGDDQALAEAILRLLEHPAEAARLGEAGRCRVTERFELDVMVNQYEAIYEELLAQKCPNRLIRDGDERAAGSYPRVLTQ
ncbi:MAG: glycosyltransferase, partial [Candidatus Methylomirabilis sp.]